MARSGNQSEKYLTTAASGAGRPSSAMLSTVCRGTVNPPTDNRADGKWHDRISEETLFGWQFLEPGQPRSLARRLLANGHDTPRNHINLATIGIRLGLSLIHI